MSKRFKIGEVAMSLDENNEFKYTVYFPSETSSGLVQDNTTTNNMELSLEILKNRLTKDIKMLESLTRELTKGK
jgi:hypothetical protein